MDEKRFGNILTFILTVLIVIIFGILGYFGYAAYSKSQTKANTDNALQDFEQSISRPVEKEEDTTSEEVPDVSNTSDTSNINIDNPLDKLNPSDNNSSSDSDLNNNKTYMEDYEVIGSIKIPKTSLQVPILDRLSIRSLELSVVMADGVGLNQIGNTTIMGHNYRNGLFFSNNHKLSNGDKIYITDKTGITIEYEIYNIYYADPSEAEYMRRDTNGKREISLSTCNNDSSKRLVIWAVEK